jgi:large subunit ribosomal protein L24
MARVQQQVRPVKVPEIRKGDTVVVLAGKDAGKRGLVERVIRGASGPRSASAMFRRGSAHSGVTVVVEGLNVAKRHQKARPPRPDQATSRIPASQQGGILDIPQPLSLSKVMLVCPKCDRPTRVAHRTLENGRRIRVCRHCGEALEVSAS